MPLCSYWSQVPAVLLVGGGSSINEVLPTLTKKGSCSLRFGRHCFPVVAHSSSIFFGFLALMFGLAGVLADRRLAGSVWFYRTRGGRKGGGAARRRSGDGRGQQLPLQRGSRVVGLFGRGDVVF